MASSVAKYLEAIRRHATITDSQALSNDPQLCRHLRVRLPHILSDLNAAPPIYSPLQSPSHIRLIRILPGSLNDELLYDVSQADLNQPNIDYVCLSYAWGSSEARLPLKCRDKILWITFNLYSALLRLRIKQIRRWLWIDVACINQAADPAALRERSSQVQMMGTIFSKANLVRVELGGARLEMIACLQSTFQDFSKADIMEFWDASSGGRPVSIAANYNIKHPVWKHFRDLTARPWFTRVWVVQELVLAQRAIMQIGNWELAPHFLISSLNKLDLHFTHIKAIPVLTAAGMIATPFLNRHEHPYALHLASSAQASLQTDGQGLELDKLLEMSLQLCVTDQRDYVYAVLGLTRNEVADDFTVNYNEPEHKLALRLGMFLIQRGYGVFCLNEAIGINKTQPSWTPRFKQENIDQSLRRTVTLFSYRFFDIFRACGDTKLDIFLSLDDQIAIQGVKIDHVRKISADVSKWQDICFTPGDISNGNFAEMQRNNPFILWYSTYLQFAWKTFQDWPLRKLRDAFWRTCVADYYTGRPGKAHCRVGLAEKLEFDDFMIVLETGRFPKSLQRYRSFCSQIARCWRRRLCRTMNNKMALVPDKTEIGDEIWVFLGVPIPFVLRKEGHMHRIVSRCYVHKMMDGQALNMPEWQPETVILY